MPVSHVDASQPTGSADKAAFGKKGSVPVAVGDVQVSESVLGFF